MHFNQSKYTVFGDRLFAGIRPLLLGQDKLPNVMFNCVYLGKYDELE